MAGNKPKQPDNKKLTAKQEAFCQAYVSGNSQSDAYRMVYKPTKMAQNTIHRKAKEVMENGKVSARINELAAPAIKAVGLSVQGVLEDIRKIKYNCMAETEDGKIRNAKEALKACELEGKHLKMFTDRVQIDMDEALKSVLALFPEKTRLAIKDKVLAGIGK